ncbi:MAG: hypothetical protein MZV63_22190 [Marinilabiliales bacterium]|nr:hypothetical protein [Marinilabiliales bacterium]
MVIAAQAAPLRLLGNELARLQHRPRPLAAGRHPRQDPLLHVPAGRDRRGPPRLSRPRPLHLPDHRAGTGGVIGIGARLVVLCGLLLGLAGASGAAQEVTLPAWTGGPTPPLALHGPRWASPRRGRLPGHRAAGELLGHLVCAVPGGAAVPAATAGHPAWAAVRGAGRERRRGRIPREALPGRCALPRSGPPRPAWGRPAGVASSRSPRHLPSRPSRRHPLLVPGRAGLGAAGDPPHRRVPASRLGEARASAGLGGAGHEAGIRRERDEPKSSWIRWVTASGLKT